MSAESPLLVCHDLTKTFKDFWLRNRVEAVKGVNLEIRAGEVLGLLGPNGCGKSTTIKMILGLLFPTRGTVSIFGEAPSSVSIKARIGFLPEETNLYPFLNARETLDYYGRLFHLRKNERARRIDELLSMVGLQDVQTRPVGEYSKGMQRRIGLAQALINDPDLLILDEPTNGLDPNGTAEVKELIVTLRNRGKTVLVCSHLLADLEQICDRVTIMYGGEIYRTGTLAELLTRSDRTRVSTGPLAEETVAKIRELLDSRGEQFISCEAPRESLESLFLKIVEEARGRGVGTSGAQSGGATASFLANEITQEGEGDSST